jgi:hypothetical protein
VEEKKLETERVEKEGGVGRLSSAWVLRSMSVGHERSAALIFLFALFFLSLTPALTHTHTPLLLCRPTLTYLPA